MVSAIALSAVLSTTAAAAPEVGPAPATTGTDTAPPALTLSPMQLERAQPSDPPGHELGSLIGLGSVYAGMTIWSYFAWYYDKPALPEFKVGGDGYFGEDTYAGGADKLGHLWANLALSRGTTELLRWGGWRPLPASAIAS